MTDRGYFHMAQKLDQNGIEVPFDPFVRVNMTFIATASEVLGIEVSTDDYSRYFEEPEQEKSPEMDRLNDFLDLVMTSINKGQYPDIEKFSAITGIDPVETKMLVEHVWKKVRGK
jgi:hypothetical protein